MTIAGNGGLKGRGPACRPARYGLGSVADVEEKSGDEWAKGLEWDQLPCGEDAGAVAGPCPDLPEHLKTAVRGFDTLHSDAFILYAGWECSTGGGKVEDAWDNAEELLIRNWWRGLERVFWTGLDQDGNPVRETLGTVEVEDLTPLAGALDITSGVAVLESFAADCNDCEPVILANRGMAAYLAERGLFERDGDRLRMLGTGSLFVPGSGFLATGPNEDESGGGTPAGEAWMYVTGGIAITHGATFFTPGRGDLAGAVDRSVNDVRVFAERFAAFQVACCVGAVRVTLGSCCGSGGSGDEDDDLELE